MFTLSLQTSHEQTIFQDANNNNVKAYTLDKLHIRNRQYTLTMDEIARLSPAHCVLLAVHFATESNIAALRALTSSRSDALETDLILRILLTFLPESADPALYTSYVHELGIKTYLDQGPKGTGVDSSSVVALSDSKARTRAKRLEILPLAHSSCQDEALDSITLFCIHRAHLIDSQTGLLTLVPQLVDPFLDQSDFLRTWFISTILPLLRFNYEYYVRENPSPSLEAFDKLAGGRGVEVLLSRAIESSTENESPNTARDLRGLVGPWMFGSSTRKRRKLNRGAQHGSIAAPALTPAQNETLQSMSLEETAQDLITDHDWESVFIWLVRNAVNRFPLVVSAIDEWGGIEDVDYGGYGEQNLVEEVAAKLKVQYRQAGFATVYAVEADTESTIENAHSVLCRLADLCDLEPPPELATSIELLPKVDAASSILHETSSNVLQPDVLLKDGHPLTTPKVETFSLLQMFVYSAYLLNGLGHPMSIRNVAKLRFHNDGDEQLSMFQEILRKLASKQKKIDDAWILSRQTLLWLWNWGMDEEEPAQYGTGILGKIDHGIFESEILKVLLAAGNFDLVKQIYVPETNDTLKHRLSPEEIEHIILIAAMQSYDNASNGNRTRGGMKKASDIVATFAPLFPHSGAFKRIEALLKATHALSFYSLTLQHGVPFQPVNIRVAADPIGLLIKVLRQNSHSYTQLDNLIAIGKNLVEAGLQTDTRVTSFTPEDETTATPAMFSLLASDAGSEIGSDAANPLFIEPSPTAITSAKALAERRITGMAIDAALKEDDFETAYSYVVNRLNPPLPVTSTATPSTSPPPMSPDASSSDVRKDSAYLRPALSTTTTGSRRRSGTVTSSSTAIRSTSSDDISWRAALLAGRYKSPNAQPSPSSSIAYLTKSPHLNPLRRLEQRMDLLSRSLLLAPADAIVEILNVWRRCEEEYAALLAQEEREEAEHADRAEGGGRIPGGFGQLGVYDGRELGQARREVGREAREEAPMGLFDVARGAASALSRSAFPLRGGQRPSGARMSVDSAGGQGHSRSGSEAGSTEEGRVRKRDMVASAVTGGLASGIGWVLGAKPVDQGGH
ncbi:secretory pathway Sec39 [Aulographum hederae CBS 113979]|uniref:Secretory pathway Sec39 n=1 Tax=Aulographum hederae CBS 113979 TaxID=1176131 RepID=A0A6G1GWF0_9PEZI|nr:secretory pathway Sec39 [Aulographum hederae CBS 113979]